MTRHVRIWTVEMLAGGNLLEPTTFRVVASNVTQAATKALVRAKKKRTVRNRIQDIERIELLGEAEV